MPLQNVCKASICDQWCCPTPRIELKYAPSFLRTTPITLHLEYMNLIVQATQPIATTHLDHLGKLAQSKPCEQIAAHVYRFTAGQAHPEIASYCFANQLDYGFVPNGLKLANFGLLVMDMDSTLIAIECIDEVADMQGLKPQVAAITEAAMRGEMEFAESLRRRVALLKGLDEQALQHVYDERLRLSTGAEAMLKALQTHGIKTLLLSGGFKFFTDRLKARLGLDYAHANTLEIANGKLTGKVLGEILDAQGKADWLVKIRDELSLKPEQVIAMGDGANDLKMMAQAGISIAYHAKPVVREQARYALNFVGLEGMVNLLANEEL